MIEETMDARDTALIQAYARMMQLELALANLVHAHEAPEPVRAKAIEGALMVARGLVGSLDTIGSTE